MMSMHVGQQLKSSFPKSTGFKTRPLKKRLTKEEKRILKCTHCMESGHEVDDCFKLHGIPYWYKRYKENRMSGRINMVDNDEDGSSSQGGLDQKEQRDSASDMSRSMLETICSNKEVVLEKLM